MGASLANDPQAGLHVIRVSGLGDARASFDWFSQPVQLQNRPLHSGGRVLGRVILYAHQAKPARPGRLGS
jgi:hypothetical protein